MKNNILGALVIFFAVVACLLIIDDLSYKDKVTETDFSSEKTIEKPTEQADLATTDLEIEN